MVRAKTDLFHFDRYTDKNAPTQGPQAQAAAGEHKDAVSTKVHKKPKAEEIERASSGKKGLRELVLSYNNGTSVTVSEHNLLSPCLHKYRYRAVRVQSTADYTAQLPVTCAVGPWRL